MYIGKEPSPTLITTNDVDPNAGFVVLNGTQVMTGTKVADNGTAAVVGGGTYTFDGTDQVVEITLTNVGTVTFANPTSIQPKAVYTFVLKAGDSSTRTPSFGTSFKFPSASSPLVSLSSTTGAYDIISFMGVTGNLLVYLGHIEDVR